MLVGPVSMLGFKRPWDPLSYFFFFLYLPENLLEDSTRSGPISLVIAAGVSLDHSVRSMSSVAIRSMAHLSSG